MDWFNLTNAIFDNSKSHQRNEHIVQGFRPVNSLIKETNRCFKNLKEADGEAANKLKWLIWNIRQSVVLGILPFDAGSLNLRERLADLRTKSEYFPSTADSITRIGQIIEHLLENTDNPKANKVFDLIEEAESSQIKYGLVSFLGKVSIAGWADELNDKIKTQGRHCMMISSLQVLNSKTFDQIIFPSGGRNSPLLHNLTYGSRAKTIDVVAYDSEPIMRPARKLLPEGLYRFTEPLDKEVLSDGIIHNVESESFIEGWEETSFWESIRPSFGISEGIAFDRQHIIKARLIILPGSEMVYLQDDRKILELSDLIEHRTEPEEIDKRFNKKMVSELKTGDMILLRTSGSGDGLKETADEIMRADGKEDLRSKALDWKQHLEEALECIGPQEIYRQLKLKGLGLSSPPSYLWHWTTDEVISPESDSRFFELLAILNDLGYLQNETDLVELAQSKWELMRELKHYHHKAGQKIRKDLLSLLREKISTDTEIGDILDLKLPGEISVMLALYRVFGVKPDTDDVPYKDIGVIKSLEI